MITLGKATTSFYRLSTLTMSLHAAVWPQFQMQSLYLLPSLTCAKLPYRHLSLNDCSVRYSSVTIACIGLLSLWEIVFFRDRKSDAGLRI